MYYGLGHCPVGLCPWGWSRGSLSARREEDLVGSPQAVMRNRETPSADELQKTDARRWMYLPSDVLRNMVLLETIKDVDFI